MVKQIRHDDKRQLDKGFVPEWIDKMYPIRSVAWYREKIHQLIDENSDESIQRIVDHFGFNLVRYLESLI